MSAVRLSESSVEMEDGGRPLGTYAPSSFAPATAVRLGRRDALMTFLGCGLALTAAPRARANASAADVASGRASALRGAARRDGDARTPLLVVFVGNDPPDADSFETWLGAPADGIELHTGRQDWADWQGSVGWLADRWANQPRQLFWSVQMIPRGATLAEGAAGAYDARYAEAARTIASRQPTGPIFVRTGWEFNGDWMPWAAAGQERAYVATFRAFVARFRAASDRFVFEWCPNVGDFGMNPEDAWPGDDVVDIVGIDFYWQPSWDSPDPEVAWQSMVERPFGLAWHRDFAPAHGKPRAFAEWGVALADAGRFVRSAAAWMRADDVVYQCYWNSDADFAGKLSGGRLPDAAAAYREMFAPAAP